jgi:integrase
VTAKQKRGRYGDGCVYRQKGRPIWWITWYERRADGSRQKCYESSHSDDKKVAQRKLRAKLQAVGGRRPTEGDPRKVSYEDLRQNFLEYCELKGRRSLTQTKDGQPTIATLPRLDKSFAGWRAGDFTTAVLKRFRTEGKAAGLSDARLNRYMATLRKMFNQGLKDELITRDEIPSYFPTVHEPNVARGAVFITREWYGALRKVLTEPLRGAFTLAYWTGLRVGELRQLTWRCIDVRDNTAHLPEAITKTGLPRDIFLPADLKLKPGQPDDRVFPLGDFRDEWHNACIKVGAGYYECRACGARCDGRKCPTRGKQPAKRLRYHGPSLKHCRHTAVRNLSDAGLEEKRIMDISGHKTRAMFDRYNIGRKEDVAKAREAIERFHKAN